MLGHTSTLGPGHSCGLQSRWHTHRIVFLRWAVSNLGRRARYDSHALKALVDGCAQKVRADPHELTCVPGAAAAPILL